MNTHTDPSTKTVVGANSRGVSGFTLIELMIAMLLGLIVVAGVISIFLAGQRSYRTNQALGEVQDGSRIAFEMMAQDIRKAGLTGCNSKAPVANLLNNGPVGSGGAPDWWVDFDHPIVGYGQGTAEDPASQTTAVTGSDSLILLSAADSGFSVNATNDKGKKDEDKKNKADDSAFSVYESNVDLQDGDIVLMCDPGQAALFQISSAKGPEQTFDVVATPPNTGPGPGPGPGPGHDKNNIIGSILGSVLGIGPAAAAPKPPGPRPGPGPGPAPGPPNAGQSPGNCTTGMAYPTVCGKGNPYPFQDNALVAPLRAVDWYVGTNHAGGQSLYRISLQNVSGKPTPTAAEMVRNVTAMVLLYHQGQDPSFVAAKDVTNWAAVNAVRVALTVVSEDQHASTGGTALQRTFATTLTLRNRVN